MGDNLPHQHDRDDLGGLGQDLSREADVLEGLVLAPAAHDVGERGEGVLVHRRSVARLFEQHAPQTRHGQSQDTVHEDQELRILEFLARLFWSCGTVGTCHHPLLQHAPRQIRCLRIKQLRCAEINYCLVYY